jgi:S1-C subfamily serine protease
MSKFTRFMVRLLVAVVCVNAAVLNWQVYRAENSLTMQGIMQDARMMINESMTVNIANYLTPPSVMIQRVMPTVVQIKILTGEISPFNGMPEAYIGAGVLVGNGCILTCKHLVSDLEIPGSVGIVTFANGYETNIVGFAVDPNSEVAAVRIMGGPSEYATLAPDEIVRVGDPVWVIGSPFGLSWSVSHGIVSRTFKDDSDGCSIQVDAATNPGNSGGPVFDSMGRVIGIAIKIWPGPISSGVGLLIGIDKINDVLPDLINQLNG